MLKTENELFGFYGTINSSGANADEIWDMAMEILQDHCWGNLEEEVIQFFLDSRMGRHFADQVVDYIRSGYKTKFAIEEAIRLFEGWRVGKNTEKKYGIPSDMSYLQGWLIHFQIELGYA